MAGKVTFFPVDNGDMTLITLDDSRRTTILIDVNIRQKADDDNDDTYDVASELRKRLKKDENDRPYVDAFVLSHPDQDHCRGADKHLHLGKLSDYKDDASDDEKKIVVNELWSSPIVFRRSSKQNTLCGDAEAVSKEARRRVQAFKDSDAVSIAGMSAGERIRIIGEDIDGKTDDILQIVTKVDQSFTVVNGLDEGFFETTVLGPLPAGDTEGDDDTLGKNRSSIVMQYQLYSKFSANTGQGQCYFLTGGDAAVEVWDRLAERHKNDDTLVYDLLLAPHHCSWRSLSHDSWSDKGEDAKVSSQAYEALSKYRGNARIVSSSKAIKKDDDNPPHERAKREYVKMVDDSHFFCTGEYPNKEAPEAMDFVITSNGFEPPRKKSSSVTGSAAVIGATSTRVPHGG